MNRTGWHLGCPGICALTPSFYTVDRRCHNLTVGVVGHIQTVQRRVRPFYGSQFKVKTCANGGEEALGLEVQQQ